MPTTRNTRLLLPQNGLVGNREFGGPSKRESRESGTGMAQFAVENPKTKAPKKTQGGCETPNPKLQVSTEGSKVQDPNRATERGGVVSCWFSGVGFRKNRSSQGSVSIRRKNRLAGVAGVLALLIEPLVVRG